MSDNKETNPELPAERQPCARDKYPKSIRDLLTDPPVMLCENEEGFERLLESLVGEYKPESEIEFHQVYDAVSLIWDIRRYQSRRVAVMENQMPPAAENLFTRTHVLAFRKDSEAKTGVALDAAAKTKKFFEDEEYQHASIDLFSEAGYSKDAVVAEAFKLSLPAVSQIDRLIDSATKRLANLLKTLDKRRAAKTAAGEK